MGCCSDSRAGAAGAGRGAAAATPRGPRPRIRYLRRRTVLLHGAASGRLYRFSADHPVQAVHEADLPGLVRTRLFERVDP
jgi:hypothetical protein